MRAPPTPTSRRIALHLAYLAWPIAPVAIASAVTIVRREPGSGARSDDLIALMIVWVACAVVGLAFSVRAAEAPLPRWARWTGGLLAASPMLALVALMVVARLFEPKP